MFWKLSFQLAASFVIVTSQNKVGIINDAVDGGSNLVGGILTFFGNIPRRLPLPFVANDGMEEKLDARDDININERDIDENTKSISNIDNGDIEDSEVMNITKKDESKDEASPNIIQFGKVVVDSAVGEGSKIVGGVFNFFGNIPQIFPRPTVSFERVENIDYMEDRNGRVEEDDDMEMLENSEIDLVLESSFSGVKVPASSLIEVIGNISHFSIFLDLVEFADVESELRRDGGVTVLAPDNQAFAKLDMPRVEMLFSNKDLAKQTVLNHILNEVLCCSSIARNNGIFFNNSCRRSLTGSLISFRKTASGNLYADKSQIKKTSCDKIFRNGVIHGIGRLI